MNRRYIAYFFIIFSFSFFVECSSAEKKNSVLSDNSSSSQKMESVNDGSRIKSTNKKSPSTLKKPSGFIMTKPEIITYGNNDITVTLYSRKFAQGNGVYAEIERTGGGSEPSVVVITYKGIKVPVTKTSWGYRALWGIDPEEKPGYAPVIVTYNLNGKDMDLSSEIMIRDVEYPVSKSMLNVGKFSDKEYTSDIKFKDLIAECSGLRKKAFSSVTEDSIESSLSHPRNIHKITGYYWKKRIYLSYKKKNKKKVEVEGKKSFHKGLDLNGEIGDPVYAMADGLVVLSHTMFYEGNMIIIDHGNEVFSYYQHLDSRKVKDGDRVKAGDVIGGVGATGMVTGPHLHVAFDIRGVHVDPLSILFLPVSR